MFIDPSSAEGHGHQVICHRAGGDSDTHTSNRTDGPCNRQTQSVNGGHGGVKIVDRAELTMLAAFDHVG